MGDKKADIYRCGKEVFSARGFKETKISDITGRAGIAVGSFYNFYSSKEDLFMEIYTEENDKVKQHILQTFGVEEDPAEALKKALALNYEEMQANPILREWYNTEVFNRIERCYREKNEKNDATYMHDFTYEFVKKWQAEGTLRDDIDAELIVALFYSITYLDKQKEAIGIQFFPQVTNLLAEFTMKGLCPK